MSTRDYIIRNASQVERNLSCTVCLGIFVLFVLTIVSAVLALTWIIGGKLP